MALSKTISTNVSFVGSIDLLAYIRVECVFVTKNLVRAEVRSHHNTGDGETICINQYVFQLKETLVNPIKQAYEYLKTLPEFANATDC